MGYLNPLLSYGLDRFAQEARSAGAAGVIVPDLPPEEAGALAQACAREGLALIFFLAPTSSPARIEVVAERAQGFIYLVSVAGVTGARDSLPPELGAFIARVRARTSAPLVLGFGISRAEQARQLNHLVDGFIVGSALVRAAEAGVDAVRELGETLRRALDEA
jgi:tryptophan synthase alpha chain